MQLLHQVSTAALSSQKTVPPLLPTKARLKRVNNRNRMNILPSRRYTRLLLTALVGLSGLFWLQNVFVSDDSHILRHHHTHHTEHSRPPQFQEYDAAERNLPQHNPDLPFPEGNHAKYIHFSNHQKGVGWGNYMQEMIFNAHLAYILKRSYAFDNFTDFWEENGQQVVSRIPLSAMISGPIIGGSMKPYNDIPRAVSSEYFRRVCPEPTVVSSRVPELNDAQAGAAKIMETWAKRLGELEDRCVQIDSHTPQIFDYMLFGSKRVLDIWPTFSQSHILKTFGWSQLILDSYLTNRALFKPIHFFDWLISALRPDVSNSPIPGLLVVHLRRGDFEEHCRHLAKWSSAYNGFNAFPSFPDQFSPPPGGGWGENTPENFQIYEDHCHPTIPAIVNRVRQIRAAAGGVTLKRLYMMTNAKRSWLRDLREAFEDDGWDLIATSRDLKLNWEQADVSQVLDMYVAVRAQVFLGNGFSSLSSNVAMLRMANNVDPWNTRFL